MDKILLEDMRFSIGVGVTEEERSQPQPCRLDVILKTDLSGVGASGNLAQGVDYVAVFRILEEFCTGGNFRLLEEIAHQGSQLLLDRFPVRAVTLRIRKLQPFAARIGAVGIQVTRKREKF